MQAYVEAAMAIQQKTMSKTMARKVSKPAPVNIGNITSKIDMGKTRRKKRKARKKSSGEAAGK